MYSCVCVAGIVFITKRLPETKGKTLEEIERLFRGPAGGGQDGEADADADGRYFHNHDDEEREELDKRLEGLNEEDRVKVLERRLKKEKRREGNHGKV